MPRKAASHYIPVQIVRELEQFETFDAKDAAAQYDIPVELNDQVSQYIRMFQGPLRSHFELWLSRSARYIPSMREEPSRAREVPEDTVFLSLIESGFNTLAYSVARAAGRVAIHRLDRPAFRVALRFLGRRTARSREGHRGCLRLSQGAAGASSGSFGTWPGLATTLPGPGPLPRPFADSIRRISGRSSVAEFSKRETKGATFPS